MTPTALIAEFRTEMAHAHFLDEEDIEFTVEEVEENVLLASFTALGRVFEMTSHAAELRYSDGGCYMQEFGESQAGNVYFILSTEVFEEWAKHEPETRAEGLIAIGRTRADAERYRSRITQHYADAVFGDLPNHTQIMIQELEAATSLHPASADPQRLMHMAARLMRLAVTIPEGGNIG